MTSSAPKRTKVFISYSHKDNKYLQGLLPHLKYYERNNLIDYWADTKIKPGANWQKEIEKALETTNVAVLLISIDFLDSQFIEENELPTILSAAETKGVTILIVILRPCTLPKSLSHFQAVNSPSMPLTKMKGYQREELWVKVANAIVEALNSQKPTTTLFSTQSNILPETVEARKAEPEIPIPDDSLIVEQHINILKRGADAWNQWREKNSNIKPDLRAANLKGLNLSGTDLSDAELTRANLSGTNIRWANLIEADLRRANLSEADLKGADLRGADLRGADLRGANLKGTNLSGADLSGADLSGADLSEVNLNRANLSETKLNGADFSQSEMTYTIFGDVDLSVAKGLDTVENHGLSIIGIETIYRSKGNIPEVFLRGAGVPDSFIDYMRSLIGKPIEYYSCFISYSSKDEAFAERLYADLQSKGVRCWFAPEDMKLGERIRTGIDEAIRLHDKLLLVLSEHSINSSWVMREVETAFEKERRENRLVLFPIRLDSEVMKTSSAWAADIRRMRHIGDFTGWKDQNRYQVAFAKLLHDLKAEPPRRL